MLPKLKLAAYLLDRYFYNGSCFEGCIVGVVAKGYVPAIGLELLHQGFKDFGFLVASLYYRCHALDADRFEKLRSRTSQPIGGAKVGVDECIVLYN